MTYIEQIARQIRAAVPADLLPDADTEGLFLIYAAVALIKGETTTRRDVHNAWAAWMALHDPSHESIRPFDDLDSDTQEEDDPFVVAIRRTAAEIDRG